MGGRQPRRSRPLGSDRDAHSDRDADPGHAARLYKQRNGSPASVARGAPVTIAAAMRSQTAASALIDVEVYNTAGVKVAQQVWNSQSFAAGQQRTFSFALDAARQCRDRRTLHSEDRSVRQWLEPPSPLEQFGEHVLRDLSPGRPSRGGAAGSRRATSTCSQHSTNMWSGRCASILSGMGQHPTRSVVTGGAGFIGSHLVDRLLADGCSQVVVFDNLHRGRLEYIAQHANDPRFEFVEGDIRDPDRGRSRAQRRGCRLSPGRPVLGHGWR